MRNPTIIGAVIVSLATILAAFLSGVFDDYWNGKSTQESDARQEITARELVAEKTREIESLRDYGEKFNRLSSRFLEREEFKNKVVGKVIEWGGVVIDVSKHQSPDIVLVAVEDPVTKTAAFVFMEPSWETKAFSLRRGDVVEIKGTITSADSSVSIDGTDLKLVHE